MKTAPASGAESCRRQVCGGRSVFGDHSPGSLLPRVLWEVVVRGVFVETFGCVLFVMGWDPPPRPDPLSPVIPFPWWSFPLPQVTDDDDEFSGGWVQRPRARKRIALDEEEAEEEEEETKGNGKVSFLSGDVVVRSVKREAPVSHDLDSDAPGRL